MGNYPRKIHQKIIKILHIDIFISKKKKLTNVQNRHS